MEMTYHLFAIYWITSNSGTEPKLAFYSYIAMALFLGTRSSVLFLLSGWVAKRRGVITGMIMLGLGWTVSEWLCSLGELGYPWTITVLSVLNLDFPLRLVPIGGVWAVGTYIIAINILLVFAIYRKSWRYAAAAVVLTFSPFLIPELPSPPTKTYRIGIIQPNIDPVSKWADDPIYTVDHAYTLSKSLLPSHPDVILWPETAIPFYLQTRLRYRERVQQFIDSLDIPVVSGAQHYDRTDTVNTYNAVFILYPSRMGGIDPAFYAKRWLVPLGERIPFQWLVPSLHGIDLGQAEFTPGPREMPLAVRTNSGDTIRIGTPVCYESVFPQMATMFARRRLQLLANLTNDGWYEKTWEKPQHAELFRLRALETGVPLVRSANTGISGWISSDAFWVRKMPEREPRAEVYAIAIPKTTPFRTGSIPWLPIISLVVAIYLLIVPRNAKKTRKN